MKHKVWLIAALSVSMALSLAACGEREANGSTPPPTNPPTSGQTTSPETNPPTNPPTTSPETNPPTNPPIEPTDEVGTYYGVDEIPAVYGVGAVTTAKLLFESSEESAAFLSAREGSNSDEYGLPSGGAGIGKAQGEAEDFNKYFNMLDSFLDKAATTTTVTKNTETQGEAAGYAYRIVVTGRNAAGEEVTHTAYYTETPTGRTDREFWDDGDRVRVVETTYALTGIVELNAGVSFLTGSRIEREETEDFETERTDTIVLRTSLLENDRQNYVELQHTSERESDWDESGTESEYLYSVYADGRLVERTQVEFETEEEWGETETEYTLRFLAGASRGYYEIERETRNGATWIAVEYDIDGSRGKFVILKNSDGTYQYKYSTDGRDDRTFWDRLD